MMVIRVKVQVTPENKASFVHAMKESITISRKFNGCMNFDLYEDVTDDNTLMLYEEWKTQADFDAYKASDHFKDSGKVLFALMDGEPDSAYFDAAIVA